jgi:hypothetical protein
MDSKLKANNLEINFEITISEVIDVDEEYTTIVNARNKIILQKDLVNDKDLNLYSVNRSSVEALRKKILDLFKILRQMKDSMTMLGTNTTLLSMP